MLSNKIDFAIVITVENCNPNGDPVNGNIPRIDLNGYGKISDVCIKRKIRNRLQELGENIICVSNDRVTDGCYSIRERVNNEKGLKKISKSKDIDLFLAYACKKWYDVRAFGQIFAFENNNGVTVSTRGPVSLQIARSIDVIDVLQINMTKSTNMDTPKNGNVRGKDATTFSNKWIVDKGVYVTYGSIFPQLAKINSFTDEDIPILKKAMATLFENDASSARPSGSMTSELFWWTHKTKDGACSSAKVHRSLNITSSLEYPYYTCDPKKINDVELEVIK